MMRIGAAIADSLPLSVGKNKSTIRGVDEIPGWVGDASEKTETLGRLGLGGARSLASRENRRFECSEGDREAITLEERIQSLEKMREQTEKEIRECEGVDRV